MFTNILKFGVKWFRNKGTIDNNHFSLRKTGNDIFKSEIQYWCSAGEVRSKGHDGQMKGEYCNLVQTQERKGGQGERLIVETSTGQVTCCRTAQAGPQPLQYTIVKFQYFIGSNSTRGNHFSHVWYIISNQPVKCPYLQLIFMELLAAAKKALC